MGNVVNSVSKNKIPKNYGFALKTSQINNVLDRNNITTYTDLFYISNHSSHPTLLFAYYWLPNNHIPYERICMQSEAVNKNDLLLAKTVIRNNSHS